METLQSLPIESNIWLHCLELLSREIPKAQFNTWIQPLEIAWSAADDTLTIFAANRFKLEAIKTQYSNKIQQVAEKTYGQSVRLRFSLQSRSSTLSSATSNNPAPAVQQVAVNAPIDMERYAPDPEHSSPTVAPVQSQAASPQPTGTSFAAAQEAAQAAIARLRQSHAPQLSSNQQAYQTVQHTGTRSRASHAVKLKPDWTFENFVAGSTNRMALAAAQHVATSLGNKDNPLYIYGAVGVGKSHLMHAIGHALIAQKQDARVLYTSSEGFVNDVVRSYREQTFDQFKERYHNLDLLLIDDVQFLSGKERTQDEFFHTFEALLSKQSHIVLTSDTYPRALTNMHSRLVSRLDSGLSVAIDPPELEMRVAILIRKAATERINLSHEVAWFVARHVRSNVRDLEGALRKIIAMRNLHNSPEITIAIAKDALKDLLMTQNRQLSIEAIQKSVADFYRIKVADMHSKKRPASIARPRQIAMYLCKELTQHSLPEIGEQFGGRDHTTVLHAVRKIAAERKQPGDLSHELHQLEQTLRN